MARVKIRTTSERHEAGKSLRQKCLRKSHGEVVLGQGERDIVKLIEAAKPADVVTVSESIEASEDKDKTGGPAYLGALAQNTPSALNIRRYAELVRERAVQRRLAQTATEIAENALNPGGKEVGQLLDEAESRILEIGEAGPRPTPAIIRRPSSTKQRPVTRRPRQLIPALGWKWPETSPAVGKAKFALVGDPTHQLTRAFDVHIEEEGLALRGTFIINPDGVIKTLEIHDNAIARDIAETANTSAASIPLATERMLREGEVPHGGLALQIGFGAGLVYAAQVVVLP